MSSAIAVPLDRGGTWEPREQKLVSVDTYDENGNMTSQLSYAADGTVSGTVTFTYDAAGHETEAITYNANGVTESRTVSTYDAKGHRTQARTYDGKGTLTHRTTFTYDAHGNTAAVHRYTPEGALESYTISTSDVKGNLEETAWYRADSTLSSKTVYHRNAKGTLLSSIAYDYDPTGTLKSRRDATYDVRSNPTEVVEYRDGGRFKRKETSTYQYDAFGNWTKQTTTKWVTTEGASFFEPPVVTYRTFAYYRFGHRREAQDARRP